MKRIVYVNKSKDGRVAHMRTIKDAPGVPLPFFDVSVLKEVGNPDLEQDLLNRLGDYYPDGVLPDAVADAVAFGVEAHGHVKQSRKYTGEAYIYHPVEVACILMSFGVEVSEDQIVAAILHDTVEDTNATVQDVVDHFGENAGRITDGLTDKFEAGYVDDFGKLVNRAGRKLLECARLGEEDEDVQVNKAADLLSNTVSITDHDPKFAVQYLREKKETVEAMTKLPESVRQLLMDSLTAAETSLMLLSLKK